MDGGGIADACHLAGAAAAGPSDQRPGPSSPSGTRYKIWLVPPLEPARSRRPGRHAGRAAEAGGQDAGLRLRPARSFQAWLKTLARHALVTSTTPASRAVAAGGSQAEAASNRRSARGLRAAAGGGIRPARCWKRPSRWSRRVTPRTWRAFELTAAGGAGPGARRRRGAGDGDELGVRDAGRVRSCCGGRRAAGGKGEALTEAEAGLPHAAPAGRWRRPYCAATGGGPTRSLRSGPARRRGRGMIGERVVWQAFTDNLKGCAESLDVIGNKDSGSDISSGAMFCRCTMAHRRSRWRIFSPRAGVALARPPVPAVAARRRCPGRVAGGPGAARGRTGLAAVAARQAT